MEKILPIQDKKLINDLIAKLKERDEKSYMIFAIGVNSGMPLEMILNLRVHNPMGVGEDLLEDPRSMQWLDESLLGFVRNYLTQRALRKGQYLFKSRKGRNEHIGSVQFYRILKSCGKELGIPGIGTQTMRKTFGWLHYQENKDLNYLRRLFGKRSLDATADYIGVPWQRHQEITSTLNDKIAL